MYVDTYSQLTYYMCGVCVCVCVCVCVYVPSNKSLWKTTEIQIILSLGLL